MQRPSTLVLRWLWIVVAAMSLGLGAFVLFGLSGIRADTELADQLGEMRAFALRLERAALAAADGEDGAQFDAVLADAREHWSTTRRGLAEVLGESDAARLDASFRLLESTSARTADGGFGREVLAQAVNLVTADADALLRALDARERGLIGGLQGKTLLAMILIGAGTVVAVFSIWFGNRRVAAFQARDQALQRANEATTKEIGSILAAAPNPIILVDVQGRIVRASAATQEVFGWPSDELVTEHLGILLADGPDVWPKLLDSGQFTTAPPEIGNSRRIHEASELQARRRGGAIFPAELTLNEVDAPDAERRFIVVIQDVSRRKQAEERLIVAQKDQALGTLVAGVAHDFNNLLTVIQGGIEAAQLEPERASGWLQTSKIASERAGALVRQLLQFSRHDPPERRPVALNDLAREVVVMAQETFDRRIRVDLEGADDHAIVDGDPNQLQQVLMNLLVNARDAVLERVDRELDKSYVPTISVRVMKIHSALGVDAADTEVALSVQDNGVGIPDDVRERVFDPYFTTKPVNKGTGLGLATASGIVSQHGGEIEIDSVVGHGTTVLIVLPSVAAPRLTLVGDTAQADVQPTARSGSVLVVDDEPALLQVVAAALQGAGYHVSTVPDGLAALEEVRGGRFDVVMLDVNMPSPDGWETLQSLQAIDPDLPVLMASGYALEDQALAAGARGFLDKPYSFEQLLESIERTLAA